MLLPNFLYTDFTGHCSTDGSWTNIQLPNGDFLCEFCVGDYQRRGWLDASFEYTEDFFKRHAHLSLKVRLTRRCQGRAVFDEERLHAELIRLSQEGLTINDAIRRLHCEGVDYFRLVPAVAKATRKSRKVVRRLILTALEENGSGSELAT